MNSKLIPENAKKKKKKPTEDDSYCYFLDEGFI